MEGRLLTCLTLLLLYALASTPTVEGQWVVTDLATVQSSLTICELLALDKLVASIGAMPLWPYCMGGLFSQAGAITSATIRIEVFKPQVRDRSALRLTIDGLTTGAKYTSITWTRNGTGLSNMNPVPGIPNSRIYIGGGQEHVGGDPCEYRMYRPAIALTGYLPGVYQYTVDNADTPGDVTSPSFNISDSGPPSNLMLTQVNGRRVQASWTAPSNPVVDYRVFVNTASVNGDGNIMASGTTRYTTTSQFGADTIVTIRVRATATYWSEVVMESIIVRGLRNTVITPSVTAATSVTLILSQHTNGLPANQYTATLTSSTCSNIPTRMGTTTTGSVMISNLEPGIQYTVNVTATNINTRLTSATTTTVTTQESAPSGPPGTPSVLTRTPTSIQLSWTNIKCLQQNGIITSFTIRYRQQGSTQDMTVNTQTAATSINVTGLMAFTAYAFSVAGSNSIGMGGFSATDNFRTAENRPTMVRNLVGTPKLYSIHLTWDAPSQLNGILIQYTIVYPVNGSALSRSTTTMTTFNIIDLNPNTRVSNITVYASSGGGDGPSIMLQNAIITLDRPSSSTATPTSCPQALSCPVCPTLEPPALCNCSTVSCPTCPPPPASPTPITLNSTTSSMEISTSPSTTEGTTSLPVPGFYFTLRGHRYGNNSIVAMEDVGEMDNALFCVSENNTQCCNKVGEFYYPNCTRVPSRRKGHDFWRNRGRGSSQPFIRLLKLDGEVYREGVYKCEIPYPNNIKHKLYIAIVSRENLGDIDRVHNIPSCFADDNI